MRKPFCYKLLASMIAGLGAASVAAQPGALSEHDYFEELPIVLSVSRLAQPVDEAPGAVTVIDREMIRLSGARHVIDLLRLVPGFQVANQRGDSGPPATVYHGLGENYPRHMQVLVDGRSQYSPFFVGGVNWNLIPVVIDDIDHIEVVRGSNSAAYGANAVLGVVNIITRHSQETPGVVAELVSGNQGVNDKHIRLGTAGENVSLRFSSESRFDEGLGAYRDNAARRVSDLRADWRLSLRDEMQLQVGEVELSQQMGSGSSYDPLREQKQRQQFVQLGWHRTLSENEEVGVRYYRSEERAVDSFSFQLWDYLASQLEPAKVPLIPFVFPTNYVVPVDYGFTSVRDNLEATHTLRPSRDTRLVWGGELRSDSVRGAMYYGRPDDVSQTIGRLFGNFEWRAAPAWVTNWGATWEYDSNSKTTFAPRAAVSWHVVPGQTLRAVVARAYRTPSLFETHNNFAFASSTGVILKRMFLSAGPVEPEVVTSRELGWVAEFKPFKLTGDVRLFEERLAGRLITYQTQLVPPYCELLADTPCGSAEAVYNAQDVRIRGIEYQWRWQPLEATRLMLSQSFIRIGTDAHTSYPGLVSGYQFDADAGIVHANNSAPTHSSTLAWMQRLPGGLELSAIYHSVGAMKWTRGTEAQQWQRLDWRLGYPFRVGATRGELAFAVQNDGNPHAEHAASELVSRRSFVTLRLEY